MYEVVLSEGVLKIIPESVPGKNWIEELVEDLSWEDMDLYQSHEDGWTYITHMNSQLVFPMDDYGYDLMADIRAGKPIEVCGRDNLPDYEGYEWNQQE